MPEHGTRVVMMFGTSERYNGLTGEMAVRHIFTTKQSWDFVAVRSHRLFTPDLIESADLLILCSDGAPEPVDFFADGGGVSSLVTPGEALYRDEMVDALIEHVESGAGLMALQSTVMCGHRRFLDFLDVATLEPHNLEPIWYTHLNGAHPVAAGVGRFSVLVDEQPLVVVRSETTATLFESTAVHEKRQGVSGWALERGNGRIVGLLPGATHHAYHTPEYETLLWRAAHWALHREIPNYPNAENRYYT